MNIIMEYLNDLSNNNNRVWYKDHEIQRKKALSLFEQLLQNIIDELSIHDKTIVGLNPKSLIFRQARDARFSKDLPPYKTAFVAQIASSSITPIPVGYYVAIEPNKSLIGAGFYLDHIAQASNLIREYIVDHAQEFMQIISRPEFINYFVVKGEVLKKTPKGFDQNNELIPYIKMKSWYVEYPLTDSELMSDSIAIDIARLFDIMRPFNQFIANALKELRLTR